MTAAVGRPGERNGRCDRSTPKASFKEVCKAALQKIQNAGNAAQDWLDALEKSRLTPRYYLTIALIVMQEMFEFYDFFLVGYLVSVLAPGWHLTYGQSAMMLLSSGVGAIAGATIGGKFADIVGRKRMIWGGGFIFALGAAGCALIPDGAWIQFSLLRFVVGFGSMAATTAQNPLIVEITPTRYRTFVSSMMVVPVALGTMFAAMISAGPFAGDRLARRGRHRRGCRSSPRS